MCLPHLCLQVGQGKVKTDSLQVGNNAGKWLTFVSFANLISDWSELATGHVHPPKQHPAQMDWGTSVTGTLAHMREALEACNRGSRRHSRVESVCTLLPQDTIVRPIKGTELSKKFICLNTTVPDKKDGAVDV